MSTFPRVLATARHRRPDSRTQHIATSATRPRSSSGSLVRPRKGTHSRRAKMGFSAPEALNVGHGCLVLPGASTRARTAAFESGAVVAASETPSMSAARPRARALRSGSPLGACGGRARARWRCTCSVYVCEYKVACTKKKCLHFVLHRIRVTQLATAALRPSERARARKVKYP